MRIAVWIANRFPLLTACLGVFTALIGLGACPLQSLPMQHAFLYLTVATCLCIIVSFVWHMFLPTPWPRVLRMGYGVGPLIGVWCLLVVNCEFIDKVREGSARAQMTNNGKNIGLSMFDFHDQHKRLPTDIRNVAGDPLLSWRVGICPYLDQQPLYREFDLTQAWDSPRNLPLLEKMPNVFASLLFAEGPDLTPWQGFVGPGTAFEPGHAGLQLGRDFPDGTSPTILFIEARPQVPWSKPGDIPYGPDLPLPPLGQPYVRQGDWPFCCPVQGEPRFLACMADCTVRMFSGTMPEDRLRALIVRNDGQPTDDRWMDE